MKKYKLMSAAYTALLCSFATTAHSAALTLDWVSTGTLQSSGTMVLPDSSLLTSGSYSFSNSRITNGTLGSGPNAAAMPQVNLSFQIPLEGNYVPSAYTGSFYTATISTGIYGYSFSLPNDYNSNGGSYTGDSRSPTLFNVSLQYNGSTITGGAGLYDGNLSAFDLWFNLPGTTVSGGSATDLFGYLWEQTNWGDGTGTYGNRVWGSGDPRAPYGGQNVLSGYWVVAGSEVPLPATAWLLAFGALLMIGRLGGGRQFASQRVNG